MTSTYNPQYDIKGDDFKIDLKYGEAGEALIASFITDIVSGNLEVKSDRWRNGRMVVETSQKPRGYDHYKPSGINVTTAKWWVYQYHLDGAWIIVSVARLKRYLNTLDPSAIRDFALTSSNPSKGFLLSEEQVSDMMLSPKYDE
jgi:hypothetical protein